uniref:Uncharacterized protein n=1 Tax=Arundo donax TaxID=35708 RepID=A0A0A9CNV2_ARUDO
MTPLASEYGLSVKDESDSRRFELLPPSDICANSDMLFEVSLCAVCLFFCLIYLPLPLVKSTYILSPSVFSEFSSIHSVNSRSQLLDFSFFSNSAVFINEAIFMS